jgi:hypothetical protein
MSHKPYLLITEDLRNGVLKSQNGTLLVHSEIIDHYFLGETEELFEKTLQSPGLNLEA